VVEVVAVAFAHPALDVQERALTIAERHVGRCDDGVRAALARAAAGLGADLAVRAEKVFGPSDAATALPEPLHTSPSRRPMPQPITSPAELAAELAVVLTQTPDPVAWERTLDALIRLAATDRPALRAALVPLLDRLERQLAFTVPTTELCVVLERVLTIFTGESKGKIWRWYADRIRDLSTPDRVAAALAGGYPPPHLMMVWRLTEIAERLDRDPVPFLVSTPTEVTGHIDPRVLIERIATAQAQGSHPWPVDLAQALLRLPRSVPADVVGEARSLDSSAGRILGVWLATGGPVHPVAEVYFTPWRPLFDGHSRQNTERAEHLVVRIAPPAPIPHPVFDPMLRYDPGFYSRRTTLGSQRLWSAVLPSHREVVAANLLPSITIGSYSWPRTSFGPILTALADCSGPCGPATWHLLGAVLGSARDDERVAAVDAALALNGTGDLDGQAFGAAIGRLVDDGYIKLTRVVTALTDLAAAAADRAVWHTVAALLGEVLPHQKPPTGTADLLALAARLAGPGQAGPPIAGLTEVAARTGSSRLVTEARRLTRILAG
jgi:hypothetical protein